MRVLVACEFSGVVRDAFSRRGHYAMSCDLLPTDSPGNHYQGDVMDIIGDGGDLMIAHPPCTYLSNSGVRWLFSQPERWGLMEKAAEFFVKLLTADIPMIAIENPVMHGHAVKLIGCKQSQSIQPYQFGHPESKRTCLWLKNLPLLQPTNVLPGRKRWENQTPSGRNNLPPSESRWKQRSKTYVGIAEAMAEQWGDNVSFGQGERNV